MSILEELEDLESAEEFLDYFRIEYDPDKLNPVRLHVLARFREYKYQIDNCHGDAEDGQKFTWYAEALARAYEDCAGEMTMEKRQYLIQNTSKSCACAGKCVEIQQSPTFVPIK